MALLRLLLPNRNCFRNFSTKSMDIQPNFGIVFDIDGVIVKGSNVFPFVPESFKHLVTSDNKFRVPTVFVSNSGNSLPHEKAEDLSRWLGVHVTENQVVLSYSPLRMFKDYHNKRVLLSGQGNVRKIASMLGFENTLTMSDLVNNFPNLDYVNKDKRNPLNGPIDKNFKKIDGIILLNEPINWESSLQLIVDLLMTNGMPRNILSPVPYPHIFVIACNMDLLWASEAPLARYGHGAFLVCLESLFKKITGKDIIYTALVGKPSLLTYFYACNQIAEHAKSIGINEKISKIYTIGDNINTDIYGANLFNKYLEAHGDSDLTIPMLPEANISDFSGLQIKICISILVQTGVHNSESKFYVHHSHKDYLPLDQNLCKPTIITKNLSSAIDLIFKNERL